ncbi:Protein of unknown function DUF1814 [Penicillium concentricum]|uniref:Uncharacterized protein n=1 Tax=Penicillium concentricum TaxID=293559 RepID=A0A9W9S4L8_9EURO|nr:Protein of unknown function DUF1814 [Penicillium concentricum]KAJ5371917.1 Protein of unknown function DUF1814 [Penicillium concentricum]
MQGSKLVSAASSSPYHPKLTVRVLHKPLNAPVLRQVQLEHVAATVAERLDSLETDYAIMGGAAVCLTAPDPQRATEDIDLVIRVDDRAIAADLLTNKVLASFPSEFGPVKQFGHVIPGYKVRFDGGEVRLIELEVFDYQSWPNRPQYNLQEATRVTQDINGYPVKLFSAEWIIREKILSQHQRHDAKQAVDL